MKQIRATASTAEKTVTPSRLAKLFAVAATTLIAASCATPPDRNPVPVGFESLMTLEGYGQIRIWGDREPDNVDASIAQIQQQAAAAGRHVGPPSQRVASFLAISGGGSDGAYGAGLLNGWTDAGTRPEFDVVTGISTGALTAPFAFLGSAYDDRLQAIYTQFGDDDLFEQNSLPGIFGNAALYDTAKLRGLIADFINPDVVAEIAREHNRGRRLLIGTAHLDAQRSVIWDIGAIASSNQPNKGELIHSILTASAAIPGAFPAVRIQVVINNQTYDELHVDGGTV
ncbi:MAG: patatin-like phospholipase family protein, partial [Pseudomonadota bacterium]